MRSHPNSDTILEEGESSSPLLVGNVDVSLPHIASTHDGAVNPTMWEPDCDKCSKLLCSIFIDKATNQGLKSMYVEPQYWDSDIVDAFFAGVAHSVTCHHPGIQFLKTTTGEYYPDRVNGSRMRLCQMFENRRVHYFVPYCDETNPGHFILLHFFGNTVNVMDCEVDRTKDFGRKLQKQLLEMLAGIQKGFLTYRRKNLMIDFSHAHILMRKTGDDQCHYGANVCANLLMSLISLTGMEHVIGKTKQDALSETVSKYRRVWGKQRRIIIIKELQQFLPHERSTPSHASEVNDDLLFSKADKTDRKPSGSPASPLNIASRKPSTGCDSKSLMNEGSSVSPDSDVEPFRNSEMASARKRVQSPPPRKSGTSVLETLPTEAWELQTTCVAAVEMQATCASQTTEVTAAKLSSTAHGKDEVRAAATVAGKASVDESSQTTEVTSAKLSSTARRKDEECSAATVAGKASVGESSQTTAVTAGKVSTTTIVTTGKDELRAATEAELQTNRASAVEMHSTTGAGKDYVYASQTTIATTAGKVATTTAIGKGEMRAFPVGNSVVPSRRKGPSTLSSPNKEDRQSSYRDESRKLQSSTNPPLSRNRDVHGSSGYDNPRRPVQHPSGYYGDEQASRTSLRQVHREYQDPNHRSGAETNSDWHNQIRSRYPQEYMVNGDYRPNHSHNREQKRRPNADLYGPSEFGVRSRSRDSNYYDRSLFSEQDRISSVRGSFAVDGEKRKDPRKRDTAAALLPIHGAQSLVPKSQSKLVERSKNVSSARDTSSEVYQRRRKRPCDELQSLPPNKRTPGTRTRSPSQSLPTTPPTLPVPPRMSESTEEVSLDGKRGDTTDKDNQRKVHEKVVDITTLDSDDSVECVTPSVRADASLKCGVASLPKLVNTDDNMFEYFTYIDVKDEQPKRDILNRKTRDCVPSHKHMGNLIEKCLPHTVSLQFVSYFSDLMDGHVFHQAKKPTNFDEEKGIEYIAKTPVDLIRRSLDQCTSIPGNNENNQRQGMEKVNLVSSYAMLGMDERGHRTLDVLLCPRTKVSGVHENVPLQQHSDGRLEVIFMSVVVNRCLKPSGKSTGDAPLASKQGACNSGVKFSKKSTRACDLQLQEVQHKEELRSQFDWRFLTVIAIVPSTGVFYSLLRRHERTRELVALPIAWLRLKRNLVLQKPSGKGDTHGVLPTLFALGGYVKRVAHDQIYRLWIQMRDTLLPDVESISCVQVPFGDNKHFLPDYYVDDDGNGEYVSDKKAQRQRYESELKKSQTVGNGRRNYIRGALHDRLPKNCLILDVKRDKDKVINFDLLVGIQQRGESPEKDTEEKSSTTKRNGDTTENISIQEESTIEIRYEDPSETEDLDNLLQLCRNASELCKSQVRKSGDLGKMYAFGQKFDDYHRELNEFASNRKMKGLTRASDLLGILATTSEGVLKQARRQFPAVTRVIQDAEHDHGIARCVPMGGRGRERFMSNSLFISEDLGNAVHQDINDACKCICIWRETNAGWARNWYFILPDIVLQYPHTTEDGQVVMKTYQGVAVKLYDGIMISWDGRVIRHGTTFTRPVPASKVGKVNHTYGCVYVAKSSVIDNWKKEHTDNKDDQNEEEGQQDKGSKEKKRKKEP